MAGKVVEQPFDYLKVRLQTQRSLSGALVYNSWFDCLCKTLKYDGVTALFRGLPGPLVGAAVETAAVFGVYGSIQAQMLRGREPGARLNVWQSLFAGGVSGVFTGLLLTPVELLKTRVQLAPSQAQKIPTNIQYKGTIGCLAFTLREEGLRGLFRGGATCMIREVTGNALWFTTYELTCRKLVQMTGHHHQSNQQQKRGTPMIQCISGAVAGCMYWLIPYPIDTIKTKMQVSSGSVSNITVLVNTLRYEGGIRALYQGIGVTMLRAMPSNAAIFLTYEQVLRLFST